MNGIVQGVPSVLPPRTITPRSRLTNCRVVYSTEVPGEVKLMPLPEDEFKKGSVKELQAFDDFRVRILPVIGPYCLSHV